MSRNGPLLRGTVFAAGYVVVVQNAGIPVALKLGFLGLTLVIAGFSGVRLVRSAGGVPWGMGLGIALCLSVLATGFISLVWTPSTDPQDWLRDALTYIFFRRRFSSASSSASRPRVGRCSPSCGSSERSGQSPSP